MRGEGELQRNQRNVSKYRIMLALYKSPYSSEQLWKNTGIHKNTLISRLKELEKEGIILKHKFGLQLTREI